jgi:pyruvate dehydrogenase E2 component (dihydrolipoamide acetyltransferase)
LPAKLLYFDCREIATDNFDALYAVLKPKGVTVSAMLAKAVAEVLKKHPIVNAAYVEGGIKYNKGIYRMRCAFILMP